MRPEVALACFALMASSVYADMGRECQPRSLTGQEKEAADRLGERLRKALPSAPAGWSTRNERVDVAAASCPAEGGARAIPQPVTVSVLRNYVRQDAPAQAAAAAVEPPSPSPAPAARPEQAARVQALEKQLAELKGQEAASATAYREARVAGDSAAQREASEASRKVRAEMAPVQRELAELRRAEREERAAAGAARTQAARARMDEARANRRDASVSIQTNLRQAETRGARTVSVDGVPFALRDGGATYLLLGDWQRSGSFAMANIDESLATTRVQSLRVRIDGNEAATAELLERFDVKALGPLVESSPAPSRGARAPAPRDEASTAEIALKVGSKDYRSSGPAECKAAAQASIYGIAAAQYSVSQRSGNDSVRLTLWQPKDGSPSMLSLHVSSGGSRYEVDTVKGGAKRDIKGSGKASLQSSGAGGVFTIDARAASGEPIAGKVTCSRFGAIQAEGG